MSSLNENGDGELIDCDHEETEEMECVDPNCGVVYLVCTECEANIDVKVCGKVCRDCRLEIDRDEF